MAVDVRSITGGHTTGRRLTKIVFAQVSTEQPVPLSFADTLYVVGAVSSELSYPFPGGAWPQCHGATLPTAGNTVILAYDQANQPHVVSWET